MKTKIQLARIRIAVGVCVALLALAGPASAFSILDLTGITSAEFDLVAGSTRSTLTNTYDFIPNITGGDGQITSQVYNGIGEAGGLFVYTYSIELFPTPPASVGAVIGLTFEFGETPSSVAGMGDAFFITDGAGGGKTPDLAYYDETGDIAGFRFMPDFIGNGENSVTFGLLSPNAPGVTVASMIDSGAEGGFVEILSNGAGTPGGGAAPVPEPTAALVFALGFGVIAGRCRRRV